MVGWTDWKKRFEKRGFMNLWTLWNGVRSHADSSSEVSACLGKERSSWRALKAQGRLRPQHTRGWIPILPHCLTRVHEAWKDLALPTSLSLFLLLSHFELCCLSIPSSWSETCTLALHFTYGEFCLGKCRAGSFWSFRYQLEGQHQKKFLSKEVFALLL